MKEETKSFLNKAGRAIDAAQTLLKLGSIDFAAGRAYYAMFYAAQALLYEKGIRVRKHSGIHAAFGENFAKAGVIDPKYHRWLLDAFDKRIQGDYGVEALITEEDVEHMIEQAREFLKASRQFLGINP
jgi:uncharacterized protein (UPF0332 family)